MKVQFWKSMLIVMAFVLVSSAGLSAGWAVDRFVATDGTDVGDCSDPNNPCRTVQYAVTNTGNGDTVFIEAGTYNETESIISARSITIVGAGAETTIIDGNNNNRLFWIQNDAPLVTISKVTIQNGDPSGGSKDEGGGVKNEGGLILMDCVLRNNGAQDNNASHGGGLYNGRDPAVTTEGGTAEIHNCTISGNEALARGGGISNGGSESDDNVGTLTIVNSTISGNTSGLAALNGLGGGGGGIYNSTGSTLNLFNVTIAENTSNQTAMGDNGGGGIHSEAGGTATINNTLIANNTDNSSQNAEDCFGSLGSTYGYNLIEVLTGCSLSGDTTGNVTGQDPRLGPLADNGGETTTQALTSGSPAIDAGDPDGCKDDAGVDLDTDQRAATRPVAGIENGTAICDIGAFEAAAGTTPDGGGNGGGGDGGCVLSPSVATGNGTLVGYLMLALANAGLFGFLRRKK